MTEKKRKIRNYYLPIIIFFSFFMIKTVSTAHADQMIYEGEHHFTECLERLGCTSGSKWGPCGTGKYPFTEQEASRKVTHYIPFTVIKEAKITRKIQQLKKCMNGCNAWFDRRKDGKWQYAGDILWSAKPGEYRLLVQSDGYKGCGYPYSQTTFCPSSCVVKLFAFPVNPSVSPRDAVVVSGKAGKTGNVLFNEKRIRCSADAYVYAYSYRNWNRSNRGKYDQLRAGRHPVGGESRTYIRFDLSGVNPADVGKAILVLHHFQTTGGNGVDLGIFRVTASWLEGSDTYHSGSVEKTAGPGELSWVQQPPSDPYPVASFNPGTGMQDTTTVDITPLVRQWTQGTPNFGLMIKPMGNVSGNSGESVYLFASRERNPDLDPPKGTFKGPILVISKGAPGQPFSSHPGGNQQASVSGWQGHTTSGGKFSASGSLLCIDSMKPGGAWFTKPRPYGFDRDYVVEFDFRLDTTDNHFPVLFSDGFVFVDVDWGTDLGHYQPGLSYGVRNHLFNLRKGQWYHIRVKARPSKGEFALYLDGRLLSTATGISVLHDYHTLSPQITDPGVIWFGDPDSTAYRGGRYNRGKVCWKNISIRIGGKTTSSHPENLSNAKGKPCAPNREFVRSLYRSILERDLYVWFSPGHGAAHLRRLQQGIPRSEIIKVFFRSPEYRQKHKSNRDFIRDAYQAILGREPSRSEINGYPGMSREVVLSSLFNSEEYRRIMRNCPKKKINKN